MNLKVHLRPEAEVDIEDAAKWYEQQRQGLGQEFLDDILKEFNQISQNPNLYPIVHRQTRRLVVHRFPFGIYFRVEKDSAVVIPYTGKKGLSQASLIKEVARSDGGFPF